MPPAGARGDDDGDETVAIAVVASCDALMIFLLGGALALSLARRDNIYDSCMLVIMANRGGRDTIACPANTQHGGRDACADVITPAAAGACWLSSK